MGNLRIGVRLALGFGLVALLLAGITALSVTRMRHIDENAAVIVNDRIPKILWMKEIETDLDRISIALRNMLLENDADRIAKDMTAVQAARRSMEASFGKVEKQTRDEKAELLKAAVEARVRFMADVDEVAQFGIAKRKLEGANILQGRMRESQQRFHDALEAMTRFQVEAAAAAGKDANQTYELARGLILAFAGLALALGAAVAWLVTRSVTAPMREAVEVARKVAAGDLGVAVQVRSRDETGQMMQALKDMVVSLRSIVGNVRSGADNINGAAGEIAHGNVSLSQRTEQQASSLEETASSMEELTATVRQSAANARQANQLAERASQVASEGGEAVRHVVTTMSGISASSKKIADIIGTIDGIAFQTNILALNAAVEAARAGEQGRGFAVVASEVRGLAQRSAAAAKEIKTLIDDSVARVDSGAQQVETAGRTMEEVVGAVKQVTDIMAEIAAASQQQSSGIDQVSRAVTQMDQVTQQNASLVEEAAAAAQSMVEQSRALQRSVAAFRLGEEMKAPSSAPAPAPRVQAPAPEKRPAATILARAKLAGASGEWSEF
jgi:methyl-accepting chemotaxis protein